jgi:hypothetical protein
MHTKAWLSQGISSKICNISKVRQPRSWLRIPSATPFIASEIMSRRALDAPHTSTSKPSYDYWKATIARNLVDYDRLKEIANAEISKLPECAGFEVGIVAHLPDETGCNWDIKVTHKGDKRGASRVREVMLPLRARYNLRATRA